MTWTVRVHDAAARQLKAIPPDRRQRIVDDIVALAEDPFRGLVKPLRGKEHEGRYSKVSNRYRIIFQTHRRDTDRGRACGSHSQRGDV
jgi:mRNA-degrading endonuclease RelE of RelBE toxin-antitoxin system